VSLRKVGAIALFLAVCGCNTMPLAGASTAAQLETSQARITTQSGKAYRFKVEIARTEEEQNRGLMYRELLPPDQGMVFPLIPPRYASFWMKNCPAPIDMIFIRQDGSIARIRTGVPYSVEPVESGETVAAVLEIRGGRAAELGIAEDDVVKWGDAAR
jgi:uncharacterized protein